MGITNRQVPGKVEARAEFKTDNGTVFGVQQGNVYAVYSYGYHFPVAAFINGEWYVNEDRYSVTTSRHQGLVARGIPGIGRPVSTSELKNIIEEANK